MYTVTLAPDQSQRYDSRKDAIRAARQASRAARHPVKVLREDGMERLIYHRGELTEATTVTSDRSDREERLN